MRQFAALCKTDASGRVAREETLAVLEDIASRWRATKRKPAQLEELSSGEFVAVCLASNNASELKDAFYSFLVLDGWLQRWVLEYLDLGYFVETKLGTDEI